jgi:hypothetical protein
MKTQSAVTPERRLEIYKLMLQLMLKHQEKYGFCDSGLCWAVGIVKGKFEPSSYYEGMKTHYPELYACKPKHLKANYTGHWWETDKRGTVKRIAVLDKVIANMEAK